MKTRKLVWALVLCSLSLPVQAEEVELYRPAEPAYIWIKDGLTYLGFHDNIPADCKPVIELPDLPEPESFKPIADVEYVVRDKEDKIKGLVRVEKNPEFFVYVMESGKEVKYPVKLKGAKDLRSYEEAHPKRYAFQEWVKRWQGSVGLAWLGVTAAQSIKKNGGKLF